MMIKTKSVHESTIRQVQRQQNGNFVRQNKSKQIRQVKKKIQPTPPQVTSIASISAKRLHKPSRSTIEPNEQLHYNSPISTYHNQNIYTNTFSFTHILQQNFKNQQSHTNIQAQMPSSVASFHLNQPKSISIAITSRNQRKSGLNDQQMLKNNSMNREKIMSQRDYSFPNKNSTEKSVNKSPLRTINMNKLSNTPKIKQYKKEKEEQKTFKNLLENKENEEIRFQCSQKIFKYMQDIKIQGKSLNKNDKANYEKSKSNLLSTGIINLSQRFDHQQIPSEFIKTSKGNISNKSIVETSNQQIKEFFEEDSSPYNQHSYQDQVQQLKQKITKVNIELSQTLTQKKALSTFQKFISLNNFEPNHSKNNEIIPKLLKLKSFVIETVDDIMSFTAKLSRSFVKDIDDYIKDYENSCKTNIDWNALEQQIRHLDQLQTIKCHNDVLMQRINGLQGKISQFDDFPKINYNYNIKPQKDKIEAQLRDINVKVLKTNIFSNKHSMQKPLINQFYPKFFEIITQKLQRLHLTIKESQLY